MAKHSFRKSLQASSGGSFIDMDNSCTTRELKDFLELDLKAKIFKNIDGWYNFKGYLISLKNITYLGHPNPIDIKRVQFSNKLIPSFNAKPTDKIIMGHYINDSKERRYVIWELSAGKVGLSKSSHVRVELITKSFVSGTTITYRDRLGNKMSIIPPSELLKYFAKTSAPISTIEAMVQDFATEIFEKHNTLDYESAINWMRSNDSKNWRQVFWNGFYFEDVARTLFEGNEKIQVPSKESFNNFTPDMFYEIPIDIKYHSSSHKGIFGNDLAGVKQAIEKYGSILYIVIEGETIKETSGFEVKRFVKELDKEEYIDKQTSKKRPSKVTVSSIYTLSVTQNNIDELNKFQEGWVNSNGKVRNAKIMLDPAKLKKEDYTK